MLDPWTALSLAASITQFVDFGAKLISKKVSYKPRELSVWLRHVLLNLTGFKRRSTSVTLLQEPRTMLAIRVLLDRGADPNCEAILSTMSQEIVDVCGDRTSSSSLWARSYQYPHGHTLSDTLQQYV